MDGAVSACINQLEIYCNQTELGLLAVCSQSSSQILRSATYKSYSMTTDFGNYGQCMAFHPSLTHCLAGSIRMETSVGDPLPTGLPPIAGLCVPFECDASVLASVQLRSYLQDFLSAAQNENLGGDSRLVCDFYYSQLLSAITQLIPGSGFTCGSYLIKESLPMQYMYFVAIGGFLVWILWMIRTILATTSDSCSNELSPGTRPQANSRGLPKEDSHRLAILDGYRAISTIWIVLGHTVAISSSIGYLNPSAFEEFVRSYSAQLIFSSRFGVVSFLFLSGYFFGQKALVLYEPDDRDNVKPREIVGLLNDGSSQPNRRMDCWTISKGIATKYFIFIVKRLLRIAPLYYFALIFWWVIAPLCGSGPLWYRWAEYIDRCNAFGWTNFLFVNNIVPYNAPETSECFYVSWYLAVDMQLHLFALFLLVACTCFKKEILFFFSLSFSCVLSMACSFASALDYNWSPHSFDGANVLRYSKEFYTKPQFRWPPFAIGIFGAMSRNFPRWEQQHNFYCDVLLICAILTMLVITFIGRSAYQLRPCSWQEFTDVNECGSRWTNVSRAVYISLTQALWSLCLLMIFWFSSYCQSRLCGIVRSVLSSPIFRMISRCSFAIYLLHTIFLSIFVFSIEQKPVFSVLNLASIYAFVLIVSVSFANVITVTIYYPLADLINSIIGTALSFGKENYSRLPN